MEGRGKERKFERQERKKTILEVKIIEVNKGKTRLEENKVRER